MAHEESSELSEPCVGSFNDPAALVASELSPVFVTPVLAVVAVRHNEIDAALLQPLTQRVGVVGAVGDHTFRLLSWAASRARDFDFGERGFRERNFCRRGTFQPNSQRNTATVDQYHPLRPLAALGFTDCGAPFFAGAKLPSRNASSHCSRPSPSNAPSRARQASSHTSCSSHCFSRRQQVAGDGYLSGRNRHAAPVCNTHKMPSRQARLDAQGRTRLSVRQLGSGRSGSINSHWASVNNSNRFLLIQKVQQNTLLRQKYSAETQHIYETRSKQRLR